MNAILRASIILVIASLIAIVAARVNPGMVEHHEMYRHLQHELGHGDDHDMLQAQGHDMHDDGHDDDDMHDMHDDMHNASPDEVSDEHHMDNDHMGNDHMDNDHDDPDADASEQHDAQAHPHMSVSSELDFLAGMIPHHQEAVDSAEVVLEHSERPELRAFAQAIIEAQQREIAQMNAWLDAWYPEQDHSVDYQPMMRPLEPDNQGSEALSMDDFERSFLEDMIVHHQMAVNMVAQLLDNDLVVHEEVAELAEAIRREQDQEINLMQTWLDDGF